jgi:uncharacterized protein (TIRG00374 family)
MQAAILSRDASAGLRNPRAKQVAARVLPVVAGFGSLAALLAVVNPRSVATALGSFDGWTLLPVLLLAVVFSFLQGLRWHFLLRAVGVAGRVIDHQLINLAGQTMSAVVPLGDLTRALLASRTSDVEFGATAATVTIQELTFSLLVVAAAAPGLAALHVGVMWMLAVAVGMIAIIAVLTVPRLFEGARRLSAATPGLRRFTADIEALHREVRRLLGRADVLAGSVLDLGRVIAATASLLLVLRGLHITSLGWWDVALVLAVSSVGGALSLLPGGIGANEASVVGVLVVLGVSAPTAAAVAILQRLSLTVVPTVGGALAYVALRRRRTRTQHANLRSSTGVPICAHAAMISCA